MGIININTRKKYLWEWVMSWVDLMNLGWKQEGSILTVLFEDNIQLQAILRDQNSVNVNKILDMSLWENNMSRDTSQRYLFNIHIKELTKLYRVVFQGYTQCNILCHQMRLILRIEIILFCFIDKQIMLGVFLIGIWVH